MQYLEQTPIPRAFADVTELEDYMSLPSLATAETVAGLEGDFVILGVAGKMGVTLARLLKRTAPERRVIGVARFSDPAVRERLESWGVETISCDLLGPAQVQNLPLAANVIYMAGLKFDYRGREGFLWAMNTLVPALVAEHYRDSRIVALSTIHVYPWTNPMHGGVTESTRPVAEPGEYANSVVGRERIFQYFSEKHGTPGKLVRFVYAIDMRYGVMQEIAAAVHSGQPVSLETGSVNIMWQGDAINQFVQLLDHCEAPAQPINIGGPGLTSVRQLALAFGERFDKEPVFVGEESERSLAINCDKALGMLGNPHIPTDVMLDWVADWVSRGQETYGLPSKFDIRTGVF